MHTHSIHTRTHARTQLPRKQNGKRVFWPFEFSSIDFGWLVGVFCFTWNSILPLPHFPSYSHIAILSLTDCNRHTQHTNTQIYGKICGYLHREKRREKNIVTYTHFICCCFFYVFTSFTHNEQNEYLCMNISIILVNVHTIQMRKKN